MRATSERALVERVRGGDEAAAAELFGRYWTRTWRLALAMAGDPADADDIAQTALARAFGRLAMFDTARPLRPWLDRIVTRTAIDHLRSSARHLGPALDDHDAAVPVLDDLSVAEIAEQLDVPPGTVASRLSRALSELRTSVEGERHARRAL